MTGDVYRSVGVRGAEIVAVVHRSEKPDTGWPAVTPGPVLEVPFRARHNVENTERRVSRSRREHRRAHPEQAQDPGQAVEVRCALERA
jgi:inner membrane protein involved in colicin E2 resistance